MATVMAGKGASGEDAPTKALEVGQAGLRGLCSRAAEWGGAGAGHG